MAAPSRASAGNTNTLPPVLTNLAQVHQLALAAGSKAIPVTAQPVITYLDREWRMCFMQDESGAAFIERTAPQSDPTWDLQLGEKVQLDGVTSTGIVQCNVHENSLLPIGPGSLPKPLALGSDESFTNMPDAAWVKTSGVVISTKAVGRKLDVSLWLNPHRTIRLLVRDGAASSLASAIGATVDATGVFGLDLDSKGRPTGNFVLWLQSPAQVQVNGLLPASPIATLTAPDSSPPHDRLVHVRGNVVNQNADFFFVRDDSGSIRVEYKSSASFSQGSPVEMFGCVGRREGAAVLEDILLLTQNTNAPAADIPAAAPLATGANTNLPRLTQAVQVRDLPPKEAAKSYPVRLRGVVTYQDPVGSIQFVQDATAGIFIDTKAARDRIPIFPEARDSVVVDGFTAPGDYAPVVEVEAVYRNGKREYPKPLSAPMQVLMTGAEDSQWVTLDGVVRGLSVTNNTTILRLATGESVVDVVVPHADEHPAPNNLIDAWVEVQGVCGTIFDSDRNLTGIRIFTPAWPQVHTWTAGVEDPFALPVRSTRALLEFRAGAAGLHRSHLQGTVLARRPDGSFYLQDETGGVLIHPQKATAAVQPGETVALAGFPSVLDKLPVLEEAIVRPLKQGRVPPVVELSPDAPFNQKLNGTLTRIEGRVLEHSSTSSRESLMVQFGPWITDAILDKEQPGDQFAHIDPGSTVELTGVYMARLDDNRKVQSFQLLCRAPEDVRVLSRPAWWTAGRVVWLFAGLGVTLSLALAWVTLLRRQVYERTRELRAEIEERKRIEAQVEKTHKELLVASHGAGMAEVATSVLHNVGNVLNSVNISVSVLCDLLKRSKINAVGKVSEALEQNAGNLAQFITADPKGQRLPDFLKQLSAHLATERATMMDEMAQLTKNVDHIKDIVAMQQSYAKAMGVTVVLPVTELIEDALKMNEGALSRHKVQVAREYEDDALNITVDKHKALQILVNLISNAKYACDASGKAERLITLRTEYEAGRVRIAVIDNGIGIAAENLTRIFGHGFTTRKAGHGFGLHSSALAARQLGGSLTVASDGLGYGATFTLELPVTAAIAGEPPLAGPRRDSGQTLVSESPEISQSHPGLN